MQIEMMAVGQLTPYARNARTHSPDQVAQIAASIAEFGFTNPILIGADGVIIAGHGRLMAARQLGLAEVPVIRLAHLSEVQRRALVIADNRIAENAGWDEELLRAELAALQGLDFDLDLVGFSDAELEELLGEAEVSGFGADPEEEEDEIPEPPEDPITRPGDIWILGDQRLMCGDSTDVAAVSALMGDERATLLFTSPPYGQQRDYGAAKEKVGDWDRLMRGVFAAAPVSDDAQLLVNLGLVHRDNEWVSYWEGWIGWMQMQGWRRFGWYVWDQGPGLPGDWNGRLAPAHEFVFHFNRASRRPNKTVESKHAGETLGGGGLRAADGTVTAKHGAGNAIQSHRIPDSVIRVMRHKGAIAGGAHPAVFPVRLAEEMIAAWSDEGDLLYEPFTGSGSQLIAATRLGRRCFGMELDPAYCDVALRRWQLMTGGTATHAETGTSFEAIRVANHHGGHA
ncbi:DNA modification methylase [Paracoccus thiocyanatus]|uniref:Methyltransferase n=2 Tax=Paracoccus thiocyanatus TaxID=34006 RepID=A0A1N6Y3V5_9RHOB|nr:DNA modification methylase [Paracoccus thiocyanatus]